MQKTNIRNRPFSRVLPQLQATSTRCRFKVDTTSIRWSMSSLKSNRPCKNDIETTSIRYRFRKLDHMSTRCWHSMSKQDQSVDIETRLNRHIISRYTTSPRCRFDIEIYLKSRLYRPGTDKGGGHWGHCPPLGFSRGGQGGAKKMKKRKRKKGKKKEKKKKKRGKKK